MEIDAILQTIGGLTVICMAILTLLGMCTSMMLFFRHWRLQNRHIYYFMTNLWRYGIRHWMRVIFYLPWRNAYFRHRCAFVLWRNGRRHRSVFFLRQYIFIIDIALFRHDLPSVMRPDDVYHAGSWRVLSTWRVHIAGDVSNHVAADVASDVDGPRVHFLLGHKACCDRFSFSSLK